MVNNQDDPFFEGGHRIFMITWWEVLEEWPLGASGLRLWSSCTGALVDCAAWSLGTRFQKKVVFVHFFKYPCDLSQ